MKTKKIIILTLLISSFLSWIWYYLYSNNLLQKNEINLDYEIFNKNNKIYMANIINLSNIWLNDYIDFNRLNSNMLDLCHNNYWKIKENTLKDIYKYKWKTIRFICWGNWAYSVDLTDKDIENISKWSWDGLYLPFDTLSKTWALYLSKMNVKNMDLAVFHNREELYNIITSNKNVKQFWAPFNQ